MGKVVAFVVGAVAFVGAYVGSQVLFSAAHPQSPQELQAQLETQAAGLKKNLPQDYGPGVTWFDVEAEWQTLVYKYKVHAPREAVVANKKQLESQLKGSMLLGAAKLMMPKEVKMKYELYDDGGSYIYTLNVD